MEAIGALSSIIGIVGAGAKLSILLFDFASHLGSAGSEVRAIGTEISLFCAVLKQLERTLAKAKRRYSISAIETTQQILNQTRIVFEEIERLISGLKKKGAGDSSIDLSARVKWVLLKRSKIQMHRATLESCKITLHIMLTTLDFARKVSSRRESTVETELEDEQEEMMAQSLVFAQQYAIDRLEKLEIEDEQSNQNDTEDNPVEASSNLRLDESTLHQAESYLSVVPPPYSPTRRKAMSSNPVADKRKSVWLHGLLATAELGDTRRQSSDSTSSKLYQVPHLLEKWTDQGMHWNEMHSKEPKDMRITLPTIVQYPSHGIPRQDTIPISPSSTEAPTPRSALTSPPPPPAITSDYFPNTSSSTRAKVAGRDHRPPPLPLKDEPLPKPSSKTLPSPSPSPITATFGPPPQISPSPRRGAFLSKPSNAPASGPPLTDDIKLSANDTCDRIVASQLARWDLDVDPKDYHLCIRIGEQETLMDGGEMPLNLIKEHKRAGRQPQLRLVKMKRNLTPTSAEDWI